MNPWTTERRDNKSGYEYQTKMTDTEILARIVQNGDVVVSMSADHLFVLAKYEELVDFYYWIAQDRDARRRECVFDECQEGAPKPLRKVQHLVTDRRGYCVSGGSNGLQRVRWFDNGYTNEEPTDLKNI